jgi:hypothetical protein
MKYVTEEEVLSKQTANGGWRKKDVAVWGVPWPLPPSWKATILEFGIPYDEAMHRKMECDRATLGESTGGETWTQKK